MNRHFVILLAFLFMAIPAFASGGQHVVDEDAVFSYSKAVQAGDPAAVKGVFALNTGGASAEAQDIVLGKLISRHPKLFLTALHRSRFAGCKRCLPGLLGNLGAKYVDRPAAQVRALKQRRTALRSVHVKSLQTLRNACITVLTQQIRNMQSSIAAGGS